MTEQEIKLRCLELAIQRVQFTGSWNDYKQSVAEIQTWYYNRITGTEVPATPEPRGRKPKVDKAPEIFG